MSFVGKWFGFGRNPHYDDGVRAYERGDDLAAIESFKVCLASDPEPAARERAKNYLAGSLGRLAMQELAEKRAAEAAKHLAEATTLRPQFADLRRKHGYALMLLGDSAAARLEVDAALALNPNYGHAIGLQAALEMGGGEAEQALATAKRALAADPRLPATVLDQVERMAQEGKQSAAALALAQWNPDPSASIDDLTSQGDAHMKKMRWAQAEQLYRQALERQPRYADLRLKHAQSLMELGQLPDATNELREAITLNPRLAEAHALLGIALRRQGDEEGSKESFRATLELEPDHPIALAEVHRLRG